MRNGFEEYLRKKNLSNNTISSYIITIKIYDQMFDEIDKKNLLCFKGYLLESYKPKTVNLRIQAINKYLDFVEMKELKLSPIKIQQKTFLENVISNADYNFLKNQLKKDCNYDWYFVVRFLAAINNQTKVSINLLSDKNVQIQKINSDYIIIIDIPYIDKSFKPIYINNNPLFV